MRDKLKSYVGLAQRSGSVLFGEDIIVERKRLARLVLVDTNAPEKYKKRLIGKLSELPTYEVEELCELVHREGVYAIALTNENLANAIINILR